MFSLLLESRAATVQQARGLSGSSAGSTAVSIAIHGTLVMALIIFTATQRPAKDPETPIERLRMTEFKRPEVPVAPATPPSAPHAAAITPAVAAPPLLPVLPTVIDIPNTIPPIDLARAPTSADDFATGRRGSPNGITGGTGDVSATASPGGYFSEAQVEKPVLLVPGTKGPAFPDVLRSIGTQGTVLAQFVVDSTGRALADTFTALHSDHPLFTASVRTALSRMRFVPAEIGGRKVAQLVQQPFQFTLH
jgi:protein TonB